jgi:hypothetical protein
VSKEQSFRHPHTRLTVDELRKGTALAISIAFKVASSALDQFLKTREELVPIRWKRFASLPRFASSRESTMHRIQVSRCANTHTEYSWLKIEPGIRQVPSPKTGLIGVSNQAWHHIFRAAF